LLGEFEQLNRNISDLNRDYGLELMPRRIGDVPEEHVGHGNARAEFGVAHPANDSYVDMEAHHKVAGADDGGSCPCIIL
jgi:hypothetical protein